MEHAPTKVYGFRTCQKVFETEPNQIQRVFIEKPLVRKFGPLLQWCAKSRRAYHIVTQGDLNRLTKSTHHEGVCLVIDPPEQTPWSDTLKLLSSQQKSICMLYLDGVGNSHNVGAIVRSAAFFGVQCVAVDGRSMSRLAPSGRRISEGGAESTPLYFWENPAQELKQLQKIGFKIFATSSQAHRSLYDIAFPAKSVVVLGHEIHGVSDEISALSDEPLAIPGSGSLSSLNVSSACAVILSQWNQQRLTRS